MVFLSVAAAVLGLPLTWVSGDATGAVFVGVSIGRFRYTSLVLLASVPALAPVSGEQSLPLLVAVTRLFLMGCVPQVPLFFDQLPLGLIPQTERERLTFAWVSWVGYLGSALVSVPGQVRVADMATAPAWIVAALCLPTLLVVLRRPNEGDIHARRERATTRLATWIRGRPSLANQ